jgi:hypothetical protein
VYDIIHTLEKILEGIKMKKLLQLSLIIFVILMVLAPNFVQATRVNMNLTPNTTATENPSTQNTSSENTSIDDNNTISEPENTAGNTDRLSPTTTNNSASISTLNELPESGLGLNNIINIILIVIGVLLILLGIAILIRLKQ